MIVPIKVVNSHMCCVQGTCWDSRLCAGTTRALWRLVRAESYLLLEEVHD